MDKLNKAMMQFDALADGIARGLSGKKSLPRNDNPGGWDG
jgi:hypothetical protein